MLLKVKIINQMPQYVGGHETEALIFIGPLTSNTVDSELHIAHGFVTDQR